MSERESQSTGSSRKHLKSQSQQRPLALRVAPVFRKRGESTRPDRSTSDVDLDSFVDGLSSEMRHSPKRIWFFESLSHQALVPPPTPKHETLRPKIWTRLHIAIKGLLVQHSASRATDQCFCLNARGHKPQFSTPNARHAKCSADLVTSTVCSTTVREHNVLHLFSGQDKTGRPSHLPNINWGSGKLSALFVVFGC